MHFIYPFGYALYTSWTAASVCQMYWLRVPEPYIRHSAVRKPMRLLRPQPCNPFFVWGTSCLYLPPQDGNSSRSATGIATLLHQKRKAAAAHGLYMKRNLYMASGRPRRGIFTKDSRDACICLKLIYTFTLFAGIFINLVLG